MLREAQCVCTVTVQAVKLIQEKSTAQETTRKRKTRKSQRTKVSEVKAELCQFH